MTLYLVALEISKTHERLSGLRVLVPNLLIPNKRYAIDYVSSILRSTLAPALEEKVRGNCCFRYGTTCLARDFGFGYCGVQNLGYIPFDEGHAHLWMEKLCYHNHDFSILL